jgi:hypothetical protein
MANLIGITMKDFIMARCLLTVTQMWGCPPAEPHDLPKDPDINCCIANIHVFDNTPRTVVILGTDAWTNLNFLIVTLSVVPRNSASTRKLQWHGSISS